MRATNPAAMGHAIRASRGRSAASTRKARPRPAGRQAPRRRAGRSIRWDRVGRLALLCMLCGILALYVSPLLTWRSQTSTADAQRAELQALEREQDRLETRLESLRSREALEAEARRLGMVRRGETALAIENLPER